MILSLRENVGYQVPTGSSLSTKRENSEVDVY